MGLNAGDLSDHWSPRVDNPGGFFELKAVVNLNTELLDWLGGSWDCPPVPPDGWMDESEVEAYLTRAHGLMASSLGSDHFVLKDPRMALLLPFWRRALLDHCCAVMIVRDPVEVAWSLKLRDGFSVLTGLALWGAYNRRAVVGLVGLPVHVCRYEDLVVSPNTVLASISQSLAEWGQLSGEFDIESSSATIRRNLRRGTWPRTHPELSDVPDSLDSLNKFLTDQLGNHAHFEPGPAPDAGWWEGPLLRERRIARVDLRASEKVTGQLQVESADQLREIDELRKALDAVHVAATDARADWDVAVSERDVAVSERDVAVSERDVAVSERDVAVHERDHALAQLVARTTALEIAQSEQLLLEQRWAQLEGRPSVRLYRAIQRVSRRWVP